MHREQAVGLRGCLATALLARSADEGVAVAVVLLALHRTGGAAEGAFVLTAWMAPHVVAAPLAGALLARARRVRRWYVAALGGFAAAIAVLAACLGQVPAPLTLAVAALGGACGPVVSGGLSSLLADLVPPERLGRAYGLDAAVYNAASVGGPAAATVVAVTSSPAYALVALAGSAALAALLALRLPARRPPLVPHPTAQPTGSRTTTGGRATDGEDGPDSGRGTDGEDGPDSVRATDSRRATDSEAGQRVPSFRADLVAGLLAVLRIPQLRAITTSTTLAFVGLGGLGTTAVLLAESRGSPGAGGLLVTAFAVGALLGSLACARWWPRAPAPALASWSLLGLGLALAAASFTSHWAQCVALFAAAGTAEGPLLGATLRIRADHSPARLRAQVFTTAAGLKISAAAAGAALVGVAAGSVSPGTLLLCLAATQLAAVPLGLLAGRGHRPAR
ncbi:MFS transporter [Streptomyces sp. XM4193]|uniref:MFS transporter n=1 Tax=Streptomyces sp. XM4193 TaxID=2929782 RepID=UPI001FF89284|nr:MFS transporter [Streptomyces sp. XM4193]MCK1796631.1 MFS transporter [Streptomyces sp. XM4193]